VIDRYDVGATYDPDRPGALVGAIREVLGDQARLAELRANATAAAAELNWEVESRRLLELVDANAR